MSKGLPQPDGQDKKATVEATAGDDNTRGLAGSNALLLRITIESKNGGMWIAVPERIGEYGFATARQRVDRIGAELVSAELNTDTVDLIGYPVRRLPLERGFNTIDVYYRP